jgi:hypothetical protein
MWQMGAEQTVLGQRREEFRLRPGLSDFRMLPHRLGKPLRHCVSH